MTEKPETKRNHRYVYCDLKASDKARDVYLKKGADAAAFFSWASSRASCIHTCGLTDISLGKLARATGMDSDILLEVLSELVPFGVIYDSEHEVLFVEDVAEQYIEFSRRNTYRVTGIEKHLSTIPDCPPKVRFTHHLYPSRAIEMKGSEGATSQVTSEVTSQVTSAQPFGGEM